MIAAEKRGVEELQKLLVGDINQLIDGLCRETKIPLENITNVNFGQTAIERMLGAGDLLVESAGTTGQSEFKNIPRPDNFATLLYKVREERSVSMQGGTIVEAADADPTEQLQRLKALHDDGILTDEEYEAKRRKLVDEI